MSKQYSNEEIKTYLLEHTELLNSNYRQTAQLFNTTFPRIEHICRSLRNKGFSFLPPSTNIIKNREYNFSKKENIDKGTLETELTTTTEAKSIEELIVLHKIDTKLYKVASYWTKQIHNGFRSSLLCSRIKENSKENLENKFIDFLENYQFKKFEYKKVDNKKNEGLKKSCLIINNQDAHYNKYDENGYNNIQDRFNLINNAIVKTVDNAGKISMLDRVIYIIGSDAFNSEFTGTTTKGTPQQNILNHEDAFEAVLDNEIKNITFLSEKSDVVEVIYVQGNHDQYISYYLIKAIEKYFEQSKETIYFDVATNCRKYSEFGNNLFMFNHGDAIKPEKLAKMFPIEQKESWSDHTDYTIFTGDKHFNESKDLDGIKYYQLPALSMAMSKWDDKNGYLPKPEFVAFLYSEDNGLTNIFKEKL